MIEGRWQRVETLVRTAASLTGDERSRYLDRCCAQDRDLRSHIDLVLALGEEIGRRDGSGAIPVALQQAPDRSRGNDPTVALPPTPAERSRASDPTATWTALEPTGVDDPIRWLRVGDDLGPYRILRVLGEGGMGSVYLAEQLQPVQREVAIKLIKVGMDTREVVSRFNAERQVLARMNHPNIARVYEAGATRDGRPYFVMEYVAGRTIARYCDDERLATDDRVRLFLGVCEAIQHAHQKGVIHRDIKPSNVLVAEQDGRPVPKVIDFGIAKATGEDAIERSLHTSAGMIVGTLDYMSPEQATFSGGAIDTRSDVYSLGVLLYELLVGDTPFGRGTQGRRDSFELARVLREEDPPRPSTRLERLPAATSTQEAARRNTDRTTLARQLRGELDWITLRALERDPAQRYSSVSEFAADLERYLRDEPVLAGPPGTTYRVRKFLRRHRSWVVGATLMLVTLVGALVWVSVFYVRAEDARRLADHEADKAKSIRGFLESWLTKRVQGSQNVSFHEVLDEAAKDVDTVFGDRPVLAVHVHSLLGQCYTNLGEYTQAAAQFGLVEQVARTVAPESVSQDDADMLLAARRKIPEFYLRTNLLAQAQEHYEALIPEYERRYGSDSVEAGDLLNDLGVCLRQQDRLDEAAVLLERAYAIRERRLPNDRDTFAIAHNIARLLQARKQLGEAERYFEIAVKGFEGLEGEGLHGFNTLLLRRNLGWNYQLQGRLDEAEAVYRQVLASQVERLLPDHDHTITTQNHLAGVLVEQGQARPDERAAKFREAEDLYRRTIAVAANTLGEANNSTHIFRRDYGNLLRIMGRFDEAEGLLLAACERLTTLLGEAHPATRDTLEKLALLYEDWARPDRARHYRALLGPAK